MSDQNANDSAFKVFGFVSEEARKNFVIFIIIVLLFSNTFFIRQTIVLTNQINDMNKEHNAMVLDLTKQITEEVRRQIKPTQERIQYTTDKIDHLATQIQQDFDETNKQQSNSKRSR